MEQKKTHSELRFTRSRRNRMQDTSQSEFASRTIEVRRVSRMVAGGRRFRFRVLVAIGNGRGVLGIATGKGVDVPKAVEKATRRARARTITVPLRNGTIPRDIVIKRGTARILMRPARPGHGIVAGGIIRSLCELAGITDISAKILSRSTNNLANAQAVLSAFRILSNRVQANEARRTNKSST